MSTPLGIGSRVRFTRAWLQSTCQYTGEVPRLKGTITAVREFKSCPPMVTVEWDTHYFQTKTTNVLATNLETCRS